MSEKKQQILALRAEGKTYGEIRDLLGVSKSTVSYYCSPKPQKERITARTKNSRAEISEFIKDIKNGSVCADCGVDYPHFQLEFDHLGDKKFTISGFRQHTNSLDVVKAEIAKCDIVCSNCHRTRTYMRRNYGEFFSEGPL
jgi:predicted transcriptional regulator